MISGFLSDFFRKADFSRHGSAEASCVECGSEGANAAQTGWADGVNLRCARAHRVRARVPVAGWVHVEARGQWLGSVGHRARSFRSKLRLGRFDAKPTHSFAPTLIDPTPLLRSATTLSERLSCAHAKRQKHEHARKLATALAVRRVDDPRRATPSLLVRTRAWCRRVRSSFSALLVARAQALAHRARLVHRPTLRRRTNVRGRRTLGKGRDCFG